MKKVFVVDFENKGLLEITECVLVNEDIELEESTVRAADNTESVVCSGYVFENYADACECLDELEQTIRETIEDACECLAYL